MGFLHAGHISLARQARAECASVVASIFVNPTQFAPTEDLAKYPRDLPHDLALLEAAGVDLVWTPTPEIMYPAGFQTWVEVEGLTRGLEGAVRPTHFRGVTTVVAKLFNAVQPDKAYFGQKDAQQAAVTPPDGERPEFPDRHYRVPDRTGGRRVGHVEPECLSQSRGTAGGHGALPVPERGQGCL